MHDAAVPVLERSLASVPVRDLHPHPDNVRGELKGKDIKSLVESIRARGILVPLTVRPMTLARPGFEILAGHRRLAASSELGVERVPCQVVSVDDEEARAIVLLENQEREDPDLFRQADLVEKLGADGARGPRDIAAILGKPLHWVATMRAIAGLEPSVRKVMSGEKCDWTVQMVEHFAGLAHEVQKDRWKSVQHCTNLRHLKQTMGEDFHILKDAPFDLASEDLVPAAGSCAKCPKTSARAPGLFDLEDLDPADPASLKKATCRDAQCWASKCVARMRVQVQEAGAKTGTAPIVIGDAYDHREGQMAKQLGTKLLDRYDFKPAKKGERGAVAAVEVKGLEVGPVRWVKPTRAAAAATPAKKAKAPAKPLTETERLERFLQRRVAHAVDHVQEQVREAKSPPYLLVRGLVAAFGSHTLNRQYSTDCPKVGKLTDFLETVLRDDKAWAARMWEHVQDHAARQLQRQTFEVVDKQWEEAITVYSLLHEISLGEARDRLHRFAEKALPTPKGLEAALAQATAHVNGYEEEAPKATPRRARRATGKAAAAGESNGD